MSLTTKVSDWRVTPIFQVGGGASIAGGVLMFQFSSQEAKVRETIFFYGGGLGVGFISSNGASVPDNGTIIKCDKKFSVEDLHDSIGRISSASASGMLGYGVLYLTAFNTSGSLFTSQFLHGPSIGVSYGLSCLVGQWRSGRLASEAANKRAKAYANKL